jgi:hypothetical protein
MSTASRVASLTAGTAALPALIAVSIAGLLSAGPVSAASTPPSCSYAFYDPSSDATDVVNGQQDDQLDLVQGTLGLSSDKTKLRVVMNLMNLSKSIPAGSNFMSYVFYWTNPASDNGPNAVYVKVDSSGNVTYQDGTETVLAAGNSFTASSTSAATGSFGSGPDGAVEVDVPLTELQLKVGDALGGPSASTADGLDSGVFSFANGADQDGPGNAYTLGDPTCIDPAPSQASGTSGSQTSGTSSVKGTKVKRSGSKSGKRRHRKHHRRHKARRRRRH